MSTRPAHMRNLLGPVIRRLYRIRVHGLASIPASGPVLLLSPNEGVLAAPALVSVAPRPVHVLPNASLTQVLGPAGVVAFGGIAPQSSAALDAQRRAAELLADGAVVALVGSSVSPGWLVARAAPVVVPVIVIGDHGKVLTDTPRLGALVEVFVGPAVHPPPRDSAEGSRAAPNRSEVRSRAEWARQIVSDAHAQAIQRTGGSQ